MHPGDPDRLPPTTDTAGTLPFTGGRGGEGRPPAPGGSRYRPLRFHARGGLGEVHVGLDEELNREVAIKTIQVERADDPAMRARFLREAEITARLEHPGIVPVYGLVTAPDGRASYAMRFIAGESLHDAILAFHAALGRPAKGAFFLRAQVRARQDEAFRQALRPLLGHFVAVCNAVAYAHSRGVVHRDLKPQNVMLGKYGETLVVDWGLARTYERAEAERAAGEDSLVPAGEGGAGLTQMGRAIGTPAYMSPEQAAGRWDVVGPASDIYCLGATLYFLLAGAPPFREPKLEVLLARVQRGDFAPPRSVEGRAPAALDAVCRKAMALRPEDRYATALDLAADVNRWLADERVTAWREPLGERLLRGARKHGQLLTGVWLTTILLGALGTFLFTQYYRNVKATKYEDIAEARIQVARAQKAMFEAQNDAGKARFETTMRAAEVATREAGLKLREARLRLRELTQETNLGNERRRWASAFAAERLARNGEHGAAMQGVAAVARELTEGEGALRLVLAAVAGRAFAAAGNDPRLDGAERARVAEQYASRAMSLLREAVKHGLSDPAAIRAEEGLRPLEGRKDFEAVLAGLAPKPPAGKPPG